MTAIDARPAPSLPPRWFIRTFWAVHRAIYRVTGGRLGLRTATPDRWGMLRLTTTGRRTGLRRQAILGYVTDGADLVLLATNGMAEKAPAWWRNLETLPLARVDLPGGSHDVRARVAEGAERARLWELWNGYGEELDAHAAARAEGIPVIVLSAVERPD